MARKKKNSAPPENGNGNIKDRNQALDKALGDITKRFGDGSIMRMGDKSSMIVEAIPTGCLSIDLALGVGGFPRGRVTEIYGPEASGKTTVCLHVVAECQRMGGTAAFIDMEHALDPAYAAKLGVDVDNMLISQPDTGEQALEIAETLVRSGAVDMVVIDSVAALVPRSEIEGDMGDAQMGNQARLMSQALRKLSGAIMQTNTAMVFTNQLRQKIGVMFGNPETTTGGNALKFYASIRIDIRRIQSIKVGQEVVGNRTRVRVVKNKVAPPFRTTEFDIMYNEGISKTGDLLDLAVEMEIINKRGSYYSYNDSNLAQGRENSKEFLMDHPGLVEEIEAIIRQELLGDDTPIPEEVVEEDEIFEEEIEDIEELEEVLEEEPVE